MSQYELTVCVECNEVLDNYFSGDEDWVEIEGKNLCDHCIDNYVWEKWLIFEGEVCEKEVCEILGDADGISFSKKYYLDKADIKSQEAQKLRRIAESMS